MKLWHLLVVVAALGLLVTVPIVCSGVLGFERGAAEDNAREWANKMGYRDIAVVCMKFDTDQNGYISCDVGASGDKPAASIECTGFLSLNSGCKRRVLVPGS